MSTLLNPTTVACAYTVEGNLIAAGERIEDISLDEVGQGLVDSGRLRLLEKKSPARKSAKDKTGDGDAESTASPARRSGDTPS